MGRRSHSPPSPLHLVAGASSSKPRRRTVAALLDYLQFFGAGYEADLRRALDETCQALDLNLLMFFGRKLGEAQPGSAAHNEIFDLVDREAVDGVVIASTLLSGPHDGEVVERFLSARYLELPRVSLGLAIPGVPSVLIDNQSGMQAIVDHMIESHGVRRIAFIAGMPGHPEAEERFQVYRDALARHGIAFEPKLVESGYFVKRSGRNAMQTILDRTQAPDAVIAANDVMAMGAIEALRNNGHRVPREIPVTGFDDLSIARLANPPLTTVVQPFVQVAETALKLLLEQMDGHAVPAVTRLPTAMVLRQSCGCGVRLSSEQVSSVTTATTDFAARRPAVAKGLVACLGSSRDPEAASSAEALLDALTAELAGETQSFARAVELLLESCGDDNERFRGLQSAVTWLRGELRGLETPALADAWFDALNLIALANTTAQMQHRLLIDDNYLRLLSAGEAFSVAFDAASLQRVLVRGLPAAGLRTAFIARCMAGTFQELTPFVNLWEGNPLEIAHQVYPGKRLFPSKEQLGAERRSFLVFPLTFETQKLGVALFEYQKESAGQHVLRDQISAALKSIELHETVLHQTTLQERSVQERIATSKRMQSLSVLAGGVAHDLNNALGPLVGLPDIILRELSADQSLTAAAREVSSDLESIKAAAMRASQTIKDLLTLGRQGHVNKEPIALNRLLSSCLEEELRMHARSNPSTRVELELCATELVVRASEAHLARAMMNLVHNALEAIQGEGRVTVRTSALRLTQATSGYEQIEPGDYAVITVTDDGAGIPPGQLGRIFEPFFSNKRVGERSGTGLGLAIVHGVVKEHDGFVDVQSKLGVGTAFSLYFPRAPEPARASERPALAHGGRARVLLVDDDPVQLRTGTRILTHIGYAVESLNRGSSAREVFRLARAKGESPYDLVILDMSLNEAQDGLEVFEQIKALFPEQRAIVASGHALSERVERAMKQGLAWLPKPYTADALARAVQEALRGTACAAGF
jgi:DNA-binding LacI/PurR family transcriptional regulator/signal transduction histidine kinase/ActR/RegA family two-component response regulator